MHAYVPARTEEGEGDNGGAKKQKEKRRAEHCALCSAKRTTRPGGGGGGGQSARVCEHSSTAIRRSSREASTQTGVDIDTERARESVRMRNPTLVRDRRICALWAHAHTHTMSSIVLSNSSPPPPPPFPHYSRAIMQREQITVMRTYICMRVCMCLCSSSSSRVLTHTQPQQQQAEEREGRVTAALQRRREG